MVESFRDKLKSLRINTTLLREENSSSKSTIGEVQLDKARNTKKK